MTNFRSVLGSTAINLLGWRTDRKIVVIESDDWGAIRMTSRTIRDSLISQGIDVAKSYFAMNDCLASEDDLNALFEVLRSVKDKNGRHAILTADSVVANPDFEAIRNCSFERYVYEPFNKTLERYGASHRNSFLLWQQGMKEGIFRPQFHGREHLNVLRWMNDLRDNDKYAHMMFEQEHWALSPLNIPEMKHSYLDGFSGVTQHNIDYYENCIKEGLELFESLFGYKSESFIAQCYLWSDRIEQILKNNDVNYIQGMFLRKDAETHKRKVQILGQKTKYGQIYLLRNVSFEPVTGKKMDLVGDCLIRIKNAFILGKPVTISTHRVNFIGSINEKNRTDNLKQFKDLLKRIVLKYPDVEFMSSDELGYLIHNKKNI